jgi:hypothetical protein
MLLLLIVDSIPAAVNNKIDAAAANSIQSLLLLIVYSMLLLLIVASIPTTANSIFDVTAANGRFNPYCC